MLQYSFCINKYINQYKYNMAQPLPQHQGLETFFADETPPGVHPDFLVTPPPQKKIEKLYAFHFTHLVSPLPKKTSRRPL